VVDAHLIILLIHIWSYCWVCFITLFPNIYASRGSIFLDKPQKPQTPLGSSRHVCHIAGSHRLFCWLTFDPIVLVCSCVTSIHFLYKFVGFSDLEHLLQVTWAHFGQIWPFFRFYSVNLMIFMIRSIYPMTHESILVIFCHFSDF
jgi:hypothetical protein